MALLLLLAGCSDYELAKPGDPTAGADTAPTTDGCTDRYVADYFNLPADHPDVELDDSVTDPSDVPGNHDWWDDRYWAFSQEDPGLDFGDQWWPVDTGLPGDPQYFAVHWTADLEFSWDGAFSFELGSDDDGWAYLDGVLVANLAGIHGVETTRFTVDGTSGKHRLHLYMAERHTSDAGFWFRWLDDGVDVWTCP